MKRYEQPTIRVVVMQLQDVLSASGENPRWQDDFFGGAQ